MSADTYSVEMPGTGELENFDAWWQKYVTTLNSRATLMWRELAWSGWYARSEIAEGKDPTVFMRKEGD